MISVGFSAYTNKAEELGPICRHAEEAGFRHVWVGEHVVAPVGDDFHHPYGGRQRPPVVPSDDRFYDIWVVIGSILANTRRLQVATGVYILPLRNPLMTARACLTAQAIAQGRFRFGIGAGWLAPEFEAIGVPFAERGARMTELMEILRKIFAGGLVAHRGRHYSFRKLQMTEKPVDIPFVIGGTTEKAIRRAALMADGWVGVPLPLEQDIAIRETITRIRAENGITGRFDYFPRLTGGADRDALRKFEDAGFENAVVTWDMLHPEDPRETSLDFKRRRIDAFAAGLGLEP